MIPELRDLVTRYRPHYLYADGDWSGSDDFLQTKPFLAWLFNDSPVKVRPLLFPLNRAVQVRPRAPRSLVQPCMAPLEGGRRLMPIPHQDFVVINDRWGNTTRTHHGGTFLCEYDPTFKFDHPFAVTQVMTPSPPLIPS